MKQVEMSIWKIFPSAPTMGANTDVTIYVKTQSLPKNGSLQKWLHKALTPYIDDRDFALIVLFSAQNLLETISTKQTFQ